MSEKLLPPAEITTLEALAQMAKWFPLVSLDSYFGREHTVEYADRLDVPPRDISLLLHAVLDAPPEKRIIKSKIGGPPRIQYIERTWKDCFQGGYVEVIPRIDANLPPLPKKIASTSGAPTASVNTMAIKVSSICFLADQTEFLLREINGFGPRRVDQFKNLASILDVELGRSE